MGPYSSHRSLLPSTKNEQTSNIFPVHQEPWSDNPHFKQAKSSSSFNQFLTNQGAEVFSIT